MNDRQVKNLQNIKRVDNAATEIILHCTQAALYRFNLEDNKWQNTETNGPLFIYKRDSAPFYAIIIANRQSLDDFVEPITENMNLKYDPPYILVHDQNGAIRGIWIYGEDECKRIFSKMTALRESLSEKKEMLPTQMTPSQDNMPNHQSRMNVQSSGENVTAAFKPVTPSADLAKTMTRTNRGEHHHSIAKQIIDQNAANAIVPPKQPNVLPPYQPQQPMPNKVNHPVPAAAQGESGNGSCANSSANSNSVETIFPGGAYMRGPPPQQRVEKESSPSSSNRPTNMLVSQLLGLYSGGSSVQTETTSTTKEQGDASKDSSFEKAMTATVATFSPQTTPVTPVKNQMPGKTTTPQTPAVCQNLGAESGHLSLACPSANVSPSRAYQNPNDLKQIRTLQQIVLSMLKRIDVFASELIEYSSFAILYEFITEENAWIKTEIEGPLIIYKRLDKPHISVLIHNNNGDDYFQPLVKELNIKHNLPYIFMSGGRRDGKIYGIWVPSQVECIRLYGILAGLKEEADKQIEGQLQLQ